MLTHAAPRAIDHGQPKWNANYERLLQGRTAQHALLGSGAWTTLQTGVELSFGTTRIPRGRWYLGLQRSQQQDFSLTLLAADPLDQAGVGAFATSPLKPAFVVPLRLARSEQPAELLDITLASIKLGNEEAEAGVYRAKGSRPMLSFPESNLLWPSTAWIRAGGSSPRPRRCCNT